MMEFLTGNGVFHWVATWSHPFLDAFFRVVTDLGYPLFYYLAIAPLFWVVDRRRALVLFLLLLVAALVNNEAKLLFNTPRPDPQLVRVLDLRPIQGGSPSFPSGHAQLAVVFWGYLAVWARRRAATLIAATVIVLICLSRVYLGAHFPIDILGGVVLGGALFAIVPWLDRWAEADFPSPLLARVAVGLLAAFMMLRSSDASTVVIYGCFVGIAVLLSVPQARLALSGAGQIAAVLVVGVALQILSAAALGQLAPGPVDATTGARVAILWLIALWAYPHAVARILARRIPQADPAPIA